MKGVISFFENPNKLDLAGSEVFIPGTSFIAKTDAKGVFTLANIPPGNYSLQIQHQGFSVTSLASLVIEEDQTTDIGIVALSLYGT